jgi:HAD superfamily hydrolase (TIGR01549 family)
MNKQGNIVKAVIFDIDGTLIDSNAGHAEAFVAAFKEFGKTVAFDDLICLIGMGADDVLKKFLTEAEIDEFGDDLKEIRKKVFLEDHLPGVKVFPKVRELFERLKADGRQTALASSASDDELEEYREKLNLNDLLDEETDSDEAENAKPEPDIFLAAFGKLKDIAKPELLVVGDTIYDAQAAVKANLKIVGVESGGWRREKLLDEGCAEVYKDIGEIFENYEKIFSAARQAS